MDPKVSASVLAITKIFLFSLISGSLSTPVMADDIYWYGFSWGGFESLAILQEIKSTKKDEYLKGRQFYRFNKDEFIVRLHIGLEDPYDLINDLKKGLKKIN